MITLRHIEITSYIEFTKQFIKRFERKDPELHFKELAHLRKIGNTKAYISKFHRLVMMV